MVAYSFQKRFVPAIEAGYKRQTVRAFRSRHARPGEVIQIYQGMRTRTCRKIIPDPVCTFVRPILIDLEAGLIERIVVDLGPSAISTPDLDGFAILDGFESREDMSRFWTEQHPGVTRFNGVLIEWAQRTSEERWAA